MLENLKDELEDIFGYATKLDRFEKKEKERAYNKKAERFQDFNETYAVYLRLKLLHKEAHTLKK